MSQLHWCSATLCRCRVMIILLYRLDLSFLSGWCAVAVKILRQRLFHIEAKHLLTNGGPFSFQRMLGRQKGMILCL